MLALLNDSQSQFAAGCLCCLQNVQQPESWADGDTGAASPGAENSSEVCSCRLDG